MHGRTMMFDWVKAAAHMPPVITPTRWRRVSKASPCPICGRPDWCSLAEDGSAAVCMRVGGGHEINMPHGVGHVHKLDGSLPAIPDYSPPPRVASEPDIDCEAVMVRWRAATPEGAIEGLADDLGVSPSALARFDPAWSATHQAWAFPMHDDRRRAIGIRLRNSTGKWSVRGSRSGLFIPTGLDSRSLLMICEGPTDTAAALTLGYQAVGRPSCSGGNQIVCDMLAVGRRRDVVIMADSDGPGRLGARHLADQIMGLSRSVRIVTARPHKDIREWLQAGARRDDVEMRITNANYHRASA